jgi:hypothetical protein
MTEAAKRDARIKAAVKAAYRKGVRVGEARACHHCTSKKLRLLEITNTNLWSMLTELDRTEPIEGVNLSFDLADRIVEGLRKGEKHTKYANILERQICQEDKTLHILLEELLTTDDIPGSVD